MALRDFILQHKKSSSVEEFSTSMNPDLCLSARVYTELRKNPSPPVMWFHKPGCGATGSVVANLFATRKRLNDLLATADGLIQQRLQQLPSHIKTWSAFCSWISAQYPCRVINEDGEYSHHLELESLFALPQIRYWEGDSSAYYSLPVVFSRTRDSVRINAGVYRLVPIDSHTLTINWRAGSSAYSLWRSYADRGERMPISVALGVDPTLIFAALFPLPENGSELAFWSFINGFVQEFSLNAEGLPVGFESEVILEGYVAPDIVHPEGRFANHTGYYTESAACPVMHVNSMRSRPDPIIPITVVGPPPTENALVGTMVWELLFVIIQRELPCLINLFCPSETAFLPVIVLQVMAPANASSWNDLKHKIQAHSMLKRVHTLILVDESTDISRSDLIYWYCMNLELHAYMVLPNGMRVVDGVSWRYSGRRRVKLSDMDVQEHYI